MAGGKLQAAQASAVRAHLQGSTDLARATQPADLVIEAVPERLDLKAALFEQLGTICAPETLLATNTSSLSVTDIAARARRPERVLGLHFFNPVHLMELLEIVRAAPTSDATIERALRIARALGKTPIVVRDSPGFASSRLGLVLGLEAIRMVEEGVAQPEAIDTAMTLGYKHPMGPLRLTDLVGLDVRLHIAEYLARSLSDARFQPPALLRTMVAEGKLGKKTGQGFYAWPKD